MHLGICSVPSNFHCRKWAGALAQAGAQVTVFSLEDGEVPGAEVVSLHFDKRPYRYLDYVLTAPRLYREAVDRGVDVLHPLHLTPFGSWAVWSGFPRVVGGAIGADVLEFPPAETLDTTIAQRGWERLEAGQMGLRGYLRHAFFRWQVARVAHRSAWLTADNQVLVDALTEGFGVPPGNVELVRWGQDFSLLDKGAEFAPAVAARLGIAPGKRIVLSPRGMRPIYQADLILEAFAHLLQEDVPQEHNRALVLLGAGYMPGPDVTARAQTLAAEFPGHFVYHPGQLSAEEMAGLWYMADVLVNVPVFDGYSAALSEARYVGAVPVVNDIPAHRELLLHLHNALFVSQPIDIEELTNRIRGAIAYNDSTKAVFSPRNRQWVEQNADLARNAQQFLEICARRFPQLI